MKQFGYQVELENPIRNLTHNRDHNLWMLKTEGDIVLREDERTTLATKIHFTALATLSAQVESFSSPQLKWEGPNAPGGLIFKSNSEHGFLLQSMTLTDVLPPPSAHPSASSASAPAVPAPPPPANQVGITKIIEVFAEWDSRALGACTFLEQLAPPLNTQKTFGNNPSPDLACVLTHRLRQAVPSPMTPIQKSAEEKLRRAVKGERMETVEFSHYIAFSPPGTPTPSQKALLKKAPNLANIFTFPEIIALNQPPMLEYFLKLKQLIDTNLWDRLLMLTDFTFQPLDTRGLRLTTATKTYGFTENLLPLLYQNYKKNPASEVPDPREAEFNYNFGFKDGGYGLNDLPVPRDDEEESDDHGEESDYNSFLNDFTLTRSKLQLFGRNCQQWKAFLISNSKITPDANPSSEDIAIKAIETEMLKEDTGANRENLAKVHLETLKYIYNQSMGQLPINLSTHVNTFLGLDWALLSHNPDKSTVNFVFAPGHDSSNSKWICISTTPQILQGTIQGVLTKFGNITYTIACSITAPNLSDLNLTQNISTLRPQVKSKLDPKGFVIEKMELSMTRSGRSDYEREKHIYLMYLVFKWSITQNEADKQQLLKYFSTFTS